MKTKLIEFPQMGDARGNLVVIEGKKEIPFDIKRIFYIYLEYYLKKVKPLNSDVNSRKL